MLTGSLTNLLQKAGVSVIDQAECQRSYGTVLTPSMMCAGSMEGGRDTCLVRGSTWVGRLDAAALAAPSSLIVNSDNTTKQRLGKQGHGWCYSGWLTRSGAGESCLFLRSCLGIVK